MKNRSLLKSIMSILFLLVSVSFFAQSNLCFSNRTYYNVPLQPRDPNTAFINNDTFPDIVVVNQFSNTVSVLLNDSTGHFPDIATYPVGQQPVGLVIGKVNNDVWPDLVVTNASDSTVTILFNDGTGLFPTSATYNVGYTPYDVTLADLNNDSMQDIIVTNIDFSNPSTFILNEGNGIFSPVNHWYSTGLYPMGVTAADFNNDGLIDLATVSGAEHKFVIALNGGDTTFSTSIDYVLGGDPVSIYNAYLNNDSFPDIVVVDDNYSVVYIELNDGTGHFYNDFNLQFSGGGGTYAATINDFNNDGHLDIACANNLSNNLSLFLLDSACHLLSSSQYFNLNNQSGVFSITSADYNMDGMIDIATTQADANKVVVLLSTPPPVLTGVTGNSTACQNDTIMLVVSGNAYSYNWTTNYTEHGDTNTFIAQWGGTQSVFGLDSAGCQSEPVIFNLTVNYPPYVQASSTDSVICFGTNDTLSVSGASSYIWYYSIGNFAGDTLITSLSASDTFVVMGVDTNMCRAYDTLFVEAIDCSAGLANYLNNDQHISVYPNPAAENIFIETETLTGNDKIEIYNATGTLVLAQKLYATQSKISLREFASGIYLVKYRSQVFRIIKE